MLVDVQNTLVINALLRWGTRRAAGAYLPRLARRTVGAYALSEPASGTDAFALATRAPTTRRRRLRAARPQAVDHQRRGGRTSSSSSRTSIPAAGYQGITAFLVERDFPGFTVGKKEDKLGIRACSTCELILDDCRVADGNVLGEVGKGYKVAIETLNEGRIGIGAQMIGLAQGALDHAIAYVKTRAQAVRQADRRLPGRPVPARARRDRDRGGAPAGLQRRAPARRGAPVPHARRRCASSSRRRPPSTSRRSPCSSIGGYGFTKDYPVEKLYRDAKIGQIYEGTSNMQLQTIAKTLLS